MSKRATVEEFIEKANKIHNNKYNYNLTNYINNRTKVKIICPMHGVFEQTPYSHLAGKGCPKCGIKKRSENRIHNKSQVTINKLKQLYPQYDFSKSLYTKATVPILFICPKHGELLLSPNAMLNGHGCAKCGNELKNQERRLTIEEIKERSIKQHGDVWDFTNSRYGKNIMDRVEVRCKSCGKINHKPVNRIIYGKCDCCLESQGEKEIRFFLEENNIKYFQEYRFEDCRNINTLPFDFYLPEYNMVIEYQGIQHYQPINYFSKDGFELRLKKDQIKKEYCKNNNIKETEIKYTENVKEKLLNIFSNV